MGNNPKSKVIEFSNDFTPHTDDLSPDLHELEKRHCLDKR